MVILSSKLQLFHISWSAGTIFISIFLYTSIWLISVWCIYQNSWIFILVIGCVDRHPGMSINILNSDFIFFPHFFVITQIERWHNQYFYSVILLVNLMKYIFTFLEILGSYFILSHISFFRITLRLLTLLRVISLYSFSNQLVNYFPFLNLLIVVKIDLIILGTGHKYSMKISYVILKYWIFKKDYLTLQEISES